MKEGVKRNAHPPQASGSLPSGQTPLVEVAGGGEVTPHVLHPPHQYERLCDTDLGPQLLVGTQCSPSQRSAASKSGWWRASEPSPSSALPRVGDTAGLSATATSSQVRYVRHYVDFANERPGTMVVLFTMVTNQAASGAEPNQQFPSVSYTDGYLSSDGSGGVAGRVSQYFNDRRVPGSPPAPFAPDRTDDLGVEISLEDGGRITLVAHSWGGGRQTLTDLRHEDDVVVGTGGTVGNESGTALYVLNLGETVAPG